MTYAEALSRMTALCSTAEHCESDVRQRLQGAGLQLDDIDRVVDYLYAENYINNTRYCHAFCNDKIRYQHWGRLKIEQALRLKGLPTEDIRSALGDFPEEEYESVLNDVLQQKLRTMKSEHPYTMRNKLLRFMLGRGFSMGEVLQAIPSRLTADAD
ncbi:MAG: RecX family transcriptional regulator [Bacteroidaceae bacterium]|nr:RecX family transcriptional regulator [Bacteroidaceae bacterium]